jgi:hypothetical protein
MNAAKAIMKNYLTGALYSGLLVLFSANNLHVRAGEVSLFEVAVQSPQDVNEKRTRTPAQQKIDSQLLAAARSKRQGLATTQADIVKDSMGRAEVDISAEVTDNLLETIRREGGEVVSSYPQFKAVRAYLTLESLETIAGLSEVRTIYRAAGAELSGTEGSKAEPRQSEGRPGKLTRARAGTSKPSRTKSPRHKRRRRRG